MTRLGASLVALLAAVTPPGGHAPGAHAPGAHAPGAHAASDAATSATAVVRVRGVERRYRLHVPPTVPNEPLPLVVAFHAAGATPARQERASGLSTLADREGFVVVYPAARARHWAADEADERFVRAVVADVARRVRIDPRRVYAAGVSNGAMMAERAGCAMGDLFAAIATVAGVYRDAPCRAAQPVPVLAIHGLQDRLAPVTAAETWVSSWRTRNDCAPSPAALDGRGVSTWAWSGCAAGADVVLDELWTAGHGWPGDPTDPALRAAPLDASDAIWAFFAAHPKS